MTIDTKASEIAAEFAREGTDRANLELAILRHMEHHVDRKVVSSVNDALETAARIVESDPELGPKREKVASYIRGHMLIQIA